MLRGVGTVKKEWLYSDFDTNGTSSTTFTFAGKSFNKEGATRVIAVHIHSRGASTPTSVTIGGVTATLYAASGPNTWALVELPSGLSGDVVVNFASSDRCDVGVFSLYGLDSSVPTGTQAASQADAYPDPITATVSHGTAQTVVLAAATTNRVSGNFTTVFSGVTEAYDFCSAAARLSAAGATMVEGVSSTECSAAFSNTTVTQYISIIAMS